MNYNQIKLFQINMKSKDHNLINYSNTYLKLQPSISSFSPRPIFFLFETYICLTLHGETF